MAGMSRYGIISDTHDDVVATTAAVCLFDELKCDCVFHLGDFESADAMSPFEKCEADFKWIPGDGDQMELTSLNQESQRIGADAHRSGRCDHSGHRFGLFHRPDGGQLEQCCKSREVEFILYGHLHFFNLRYPTPQHPTLLLNPGSFYNKTDFPRTVCVLEPDSAIVSLFSTPRSGPIQFRKVLAINYQLRQIEETNHFADSLGNAVKRIRQKPRNQTTDGYWTGTLNPKIWKQPDSSWIDFNDLFGCL